MTAELLSPATVAWLAAAARLFGILRVQPAWRAMVGPWWTPVAAGIAGVLAAGALASGLPDAGAGDLAEIAVLVAVEFGIGTGIGLLASLPGYAL
ncbi:MAG: hypothetical protein AAF721_40355, partial [Myxococcota bacterium]